MTISRLDLKHDTSLSIQCWVEQIVFGWWGNWWIFQWNTRDSGRFCKGFTTRFYISDGACSNIIRVNWYLKAMSTANLSILKNRFFIFFKNFLIVKRLELGLGMGNENGNVLPVPGDDSTISGATTTLPPALFQPLILKLLNMKESSSEKLLITYSKKVLEWSPFPTKPKCLRLGLAPLPIQPKNGPGGLCQQPTKT